MARAISSPSPSNVRATAPTFRIFRSSRWRRNGPGGWKTDEALNSYLTADRNYLQVLTARIAAADRGEFASDEETVRFFAEHGE